ncbi:uncharacterized protein CLUP02_04131 [Colletotrichum lupini]|uniref:Uncharacterized protein n=1 Tax=Colletotrichum lupini TaxID=145971 RepID=A0A9Q8WCU2_9PEZI|nr:uncharacterized protein CLUP02_04131 [Colletotrichum lupini]UQC78654.1 hypothetical protein CLUP02_04131 [Colletotrichum lupini]
MSWGHDANGMWLRPKSAIQSAYIRLPVCNQSAPIRQYVDAGETRMWSVQVRSEPTASSRAWLAACVPRTLFPPPPQYFFSFAFAVQVLTREIGSSNREAGYTRVHEARAKLRKELSQVTQQAEGGGSRQLARKLPFCVARVIVDLSTIFRLPIPVLRDLGAGCYRTKPHDLHKIPDWGRVRRNTGGYGYTALCNEILRKLAIDCSIPVSTGIQSLLPLILPTPSVGNGGNDKDVGGFPEKTVPCRPKISERKGCFDDESGFNAEDNGRKTQPLSFILLSPSELPARFTYCRGPDGRTDGHLDRRGEEHAGPRQTNTLSHAKESSVINETRQRDPAHAHTQTHASLTRALAPMIPNPNSAVMAKWSMLSLSLLLRNHLRTPVLLFPHRGMTRSGVFCAYTPYKSSDCPPILTSPLRSYVSVVESPKKRELRTAALQAGRACLLNRLMEIRGNLRPAYFAYSSSSSNSSHLDIANLHCISIAQRSASSSPPYAMERSSQLADSLAAGLDYLPDRAGCDAEENPYLSRTRSRNAAGVSASIFAVQHSIPIPHPLTCILRPNVSNDWRREPSSHQSGNTADSTFIIPKLRTEMSCETLLCSPLVACATAAVSYHWSKGRAYRMTLWHVCMYYRGMFYAPASACVPRDSDEALPPRPAPVQIRIPVDVDEIGSAMCGRNVAVMGVLGWDKAPGTVRGLQNSYAALLHDVVVHGWGFNSVRHFGVIFSGYGLALDYSNRAPFRMPLAEELHLHGNKNEICPEEGG